MRIALVNQPWSVCPPDNSADSIALVTYELARRLAKSSQVRCYGRAIEGRPDREVIDGVEYRRVKPKYDKFLKGFRLIDKWNLAPPGKPFHQSRLYHMGYNRAIAKDLQKDPCDVVHTHNFSQCSRWIKQLNPTLPVVLHMHCEWLSQLHPKLIQRTLQSVDLMLGVSNFITENARRKFGSLNPQFHTLYNGVDFDRFASATPAHDRRTILHVGRLSPEKGVHVLLQAFVQIAEKHPDVSLDLIGPDNVLSREFVDPRRSDLELEKLSEYFNDKSKYASFLRSLIPPQLVARVRFLGSMSHEQLPSHYRAATVSVVSSVFDEPFGLPLAEAMAAGVPCIATRAGAFPEIIQDGVTGRLVKRGSVEELSTALTEILSNPSRGQAMGAAGRHRANSLFSWDRNAEQLHLYYERLVHVAD